MVALCLNASLETLWQLCCRCMPCLQGDLWCYLQKGSPQAIVTLLACHALQNNPQFIVQGFEVCTPRKPIFGTDECQEVPSAATPKLSWPFRQNWVLLEDPFLTTWFSLTPHSMLTLWQTRANCLGINYWRDSNPKTAILTSLPPHCLRLWTT
jgi:hypothetical protein